MTIETEDDVVALKRIGKIVSSVLHNVLGAGQPGMTTRELDSLGEQLLERHGARSAPKLTYNFPGSTCISINEEAAHGARSIYAACARGARTNGVDASGVCARFAGECKDAAKLGARTSIAHRRRRSAHQNRCRSA